jgi:hypothetical protein
MKSKAMHKVYKKRPSLYTTALQKYRPGNQYKSAYNHPWLQHKRESENKIEKLFILFCYMLKAWFSLSHFQIVILPMKLFIKLSADRQLIVFKPGISSVIGIVAWGSICISEAEQCQGKVLPEGFCRGGSRF